MAMFNVSNYIPEMYKQFCDLMDSASVKIFMLLLACSMRMWRWRLSRRLALVTNRASQHIMLALVDDRPVEQDSFPSLHCDSSSTSKMSSVSTR